ncbi:hypothetical protein SEA_GANTCHERGOBLIN_86 [Arthrobacter phage GantcherGoblin]|nr:hypothetical protein SEA_GANTCHERGOBLIN_86 [Arthrobacter phage GantcherGoblin]
MGRRVAEPEEQAGVTHGAGWYEWWNLEKSTTHVSYVHENGSVYVPESGVSVEDFITAVERGKAFRLYRLEEYT